MNPLNGRTHIAAASLAPGRALLGPAGSRRPPPSIERRSRRPVPSTIAASTTTIGWLECRLVGWSAWAKASFLAFEPHYVGVVLWPLSRPCLAACLQAAVAALCHPTVRPIRGSSILSGASAPASAGYGRRRPPRPRRRRRRRPPMECAPGMRESLKALECRSNSLSLALSVS